MKRYFGNSVKIRDFARSLLLNRKMAAAKELNRAVKIFGDGIKPDELINKIKTKYNLLRKIKKNWTSSVHAGFTLDYKNYGIFQHKDGHYIVCSSPNIKAIGSSRYASVKDARAFIDSIERYGF